MAEAKDPAEKDRQRSPQFPSIGLQEAVAKLRLFYDEDRGQAATADTIAAHWKTTTKSSAFLQSLAALKRYGLLDELAGTPRKLKPSKVALDILLLPDTEPAHCAAMKRAALTPTLFAMLWRDYGPELPSEHNLTHSLITTHGFLPDAAKDVIRHYKKTIAFANLTYADKMPNKPEDAVEDASRKPPPNPSTFFRDLLLGGQQAQQQRSESVQSEMKQDVFTLEEGQAVLQWPSRMSADSYEDLKDWLELQLRKIGRTIVARTESPPPPDNSTGD